MAYASKSQQRLAGSIDYSGSKSTLNSESIKKDSKMGNNGPKCVTGSLYSSGSGKTLAGSLFSRETTSGLAGNMSGSGYPNGPKQSRATEPGNLKPGTRAQAKNTVRMTPGKGDKSTVMKSTGTTPKALRGGR